MECPACEASVGPNAWICPHCDHILDTSFLEDDGVDIHEEKTGVVAWGRTIQPDDPPDAVILGDVRVPEDEFSVITGPADSEGRTSRFVYYSAEASARLIRPDAVPIVLDRDNPSIRDPIEHGVLRQVDGRRSVRDIQQASGLGAQDVVLALLGLLEKEVVALPDHARRPGRPARRRRSQAGAVDPRSLRPAGPVAGANLSLRAPDRPAPLAPSLDVMADQPTQARELEVGPTPEPIRALPDDYEDLPSVSDVEEVLLDTPAGIDSPPPRSYSDVWADEDPASGINAASLIEAEAPVSSADLPAPFPDEVAAALEVAEGRQEPAGADEPAASKVALPEVSRPLSSAALVERLGSRAGHEPMGPGAAPRGLGDLESLDEAQLPAVMPVDDLGSPHDLDQTKEIPIPLSPQFLQEVISESTAQPAARPQPTTGRSPAQERSRRVVERVKASERALASAIGPGPTTGSPRAPAAAPSTEPAGASRPAARGREAPAPARASEGASPRAPSRPARATHEPQAIPRTGEAAGSPVDSVRMLKAERLFEQALKDKAEGNLVSARMNMKLALTFDPTNVRYMQAFDELSRDPAAKPRSISSIRNEARELYEQANEAERHGNVDRAVQLLERAIENNRRAPYLNRLGVILATKKRQYGRAQALLEEAIELVPTNATYERNLQKVLSMAASEDVQSGSGGGKKGGLLRGLLGRRK